VFKTEFRLSFNSVNLLFRTKLDWSLPSILQSTRAVKEIANLYLNGDESSDLPRHAVPILGDRAKYRHHGKVLQRLHGEDIRLPFLL